MDFIYVALFPILYSAFWLLNIFKQPTPVPARLPMCIHNWSPPIRIGGDDLVRIIATCNENHKQMQVQKVLFYVICASQFNETQ